MDECEHEFSVYDCNMLNRMFTEVSSERMCQRVIGHNNLLPIGIDIQIGILVICSIDLCTHFSKQGDFS